RVGRCRRGLRDQRHGQRRRRQRGRCAHREPTMSAGRVRVCHWEKMPLRWIMLGLLTVGTVILPAGPAAAQAVPPDPCDALTAPGGDPCQPIPATQPGLLQSLLAPDPCADWAAQAALPSLNQAYAFQPDGYAQYGWGPLTQPLGAGAYGPA